MITRLRRSSASTRATSRSIVVLPTPGRPSSRMLLARLDEVADDVDRAEDGPADAAGQADDLARRGCGSREMRCSVRSMPARLSSPKAPMRVDDVVRCPHRSPRGRGGPPRRSGSAPPAVVRDPSRPRAGRCGSRPFPGARRSPAAAPPSGRRGRRSFRGVPRVAVTSLGSSPDRRHHRRLADLRAHLENQHRDAPDRLEARRLRGAHARRLVCSHR